MPNPLRELMRLPVVVWLYGLDGTQRLLKRASGRPASLGDSGRIQPPLPPPDLLDEPADLPDTAPRDLARQDAARRESGLGSEDARLLGGEAGLGEPFAATPFFDDPGAYPPPGVDDGVDPALDWSAPSPDSTLDESSPSTRPARAQPSPSPTQENTMDDRNLSDDMVKLVTYDIVSIARESERILCSGSIMVTDNTSGEAFASWMIARHLQGENGGGSRTAESSVSEAERKYLRVSYRVKERWPKQSLYYEERQLATLEGIQAAIRQATRPSDPAPSAPAAAPPTASTGDGTAQS